MYKFREKIEVKPKKTPEADKFRKIKAEYLREKELTYIDNLDPNLKHKIK